VAAVFASQKAVFFMAKLDKPDLESLRALLEEETITSVIDSIYPLDELGAALERMESGHQRGKIVLTV